jgi:carbonic anhydrase
MKRRYFLTASLGAWGIFSVSARIREAMASEVPEWGYTNPESWGDLSPEYQLCKTGSQQSPIDLNHGITADLSSIEVNYTSTPSKILNNGHTIQVNVEPGNTLTLDGVSFELVQFHFHHPSEHTVAGQSYPLEVHFVHKGEAGDLAVLGVFLKEGKENRVLKSLWEALPTTKHSQAPITGSVKMTDLLPTSRSTYRYFGSLTTPPALKECDGLFLIQLWRCLKPRFNSLPNSFLSMPDPFSPKIVGFSSTLSKSFDTPRMARSGTLVVGSVTDQQSEPFMLNALGSDALINVV